MKKHIALSLFLFLSAWAKGETVFVVTNNVSDLNPARDEIFALANAPVRITTILNNGSEPLDMSTASFPITLYVYHRTDNYLSRLVQSIDGTISNNYARWQFTLPYAGNYRMQATVFYPDDSFLIVDRYLSLTSAPSVGVTADVVITNVVSSALNIYYWGTNVASVTNGP